MNIISLFISATEKYPDTIALVEGNKKITYKNFLEEVKASAAYYKSKGIQSGNRVLIFVPVSTDLYRTVLALFYIGATAVFLDEWVSKERMEVCCRLAKCKGFVAPMKIRMLSYLSKDLRDIPIKLSLSGKIDYTNISPYASQKGETALITFTTGSTGIPKAANRTNEFLTNQFDALLPLLEPKLGEVDLTMLPIVLLLNLGTGKTSVIPDFNSRKPKKFNPETIVAQILVQKISVLTASPYYLITLSQYLLENKMKLPSVKKIFTGGAPVFPSEAKILQAAFPEATINIVYGSTEAEPVSQISIVDLISRQQECMQMRGLSVGYVNAKTTKVKIISINDQEIKINSEDELNRLTLSHFNIGEICVSGKHVLREYIDNPEAVKLNKIFVGENVWHRTGDAGYVTTEGELFLVGRCKQIIRWNENTYYPFLIEEFCRNQQGVVLGTLLLLKEPTLVIEAEGKFDLTQFKEKAVNFGLDFPIKIVKSIPRDPRHFSKIDQDKLKQLI